MTNGSAVGRRRAGRDAPDPRDQSTQGLGVTRVPERDPGEETHEGRGPDLLPGRSTGQQHRYHPSPRLAEGVLEGELDLPVLPGAHPGRPDEHGDDRRLLERGREGVLPPFTRHHVPLVEPDSQAEFPERRRNRRNGLPVDAVVGQEGLVHDPTELRPREMKSDRKKPVAATVEYSREAIPGPLPRPGRHWEERAAPR